MTMQGGVGGGHVSELNKIIFCVMTKTDWELLSKSDYYTKIYVTYMYISLGILSNIKI